MNQIQAASDLLNDAHVRRTTSTSDAIVCGCGHRVSGIGETSASERYTVHLMEVLDQAYFLKDPNHSASVDFGGAQEQSASAGGARE